MIDFEKTARIDAVADTLIRLRQEADREHIPIIKDDALTVLEGLLVEQKPETILEIGTAIGYSAIKMCNLLENAQITSLEKSSLRYLRALENIASAGFSERISVLNIDALDYLNDCKKEFDFIFLDGAKGQYLKYYPHLIRILRVGGCMFADNVFYFGLTKKAPCVPHKHRTIAVNMKAFIESLTLDERLKTVVLETADGISISKKLKNS